MRVLSEPDLGSEIAVVAVVGEKAGADAGSRASHSASCHNAEVAGVAGVGDGGSGGAAVIVGVKVAVRTAAGDAVMV